MLGFTMTVLDRAKLEILPGLPWAARAKPLKLGMAAWLGGVPGVLGHVCELSVWCEAPPGRMPCRSSLALSWGESGGAYC